MKLIGVLKEKAQLLKNESYALAFAYRDYRTPWYAKIMIFMTLGYLFSPIDLIPDFIPVLGYIDDIIILPLLIAISIKSLPKEILAESREKAKQYLEKKEKKAWWFAVLIILFWFSLFTFFVRSIS